MLRKLRYFQKRAALAVVTAIGMATVGYTSSATAAELDYGEIGDPIDLVVGYQPYYTEAWSGVVMKGLKLYEKYLPEGSTVEFQIGLQGGIIVNAMLAGKQHIGYMGDMPAIVATTKDRVADIRIVATAGLAFDQCNNCLLYTSPSPRDLSTSRMPSSA